MKWQHKPQAEVWKLILYSVFSNCSHREQHNKLRNLETTLRVGKRGNWGSDSHLEQNPLLEVQLLVLHGEIMLGRFKSQPTLCPSLLGKIHMKLKLGV